MWTAVPIKLLTDMEYTVTLLTDMEDMVTRPAVLLEVEEVLESLTRPALSNNTTSAQSTSTTTSCSMIRSPCRANTASREATAAIDGGRRHGGT